MNVYFTVFNTKPGMNFDLALPLVLRKKLRAEIQSLNRCLPDLVKKFKTEDFDIDFMINASAATEMVIRGPVRLRTSNTIEYVLWIPFITNQTYEEQLRHVLKHIEESVIHIFEKHKGDAAGIHETMMALIDHVLAHPELYQGDIPK
jgi:hypothetical protein